MTRYEIKLNRSQTDEDPTIADYMEFDRQGNLSSKTASSKEAHQVLNEALEIMRRIKADMLEMTVTVPD